MLRAVRYRMSSSSGCLVAVQCPYCQHSIALKGAAPGKYKPKCPKCQHFILITVPADPAQPTVAVKVAENSKPPAAPAPATRPPSIASPTQPTIDAMDVEQPAAPPAPEATRIDATLPPAGRTQAGVYDATLPPSAPAPIAPKAPVPSDATAMWDGTRVMGSDARGGKESIAINQADQTAPSVAVPAQPSNGASVNKSKSDGAASGGLKMPEMLGGYKVMKELGRGAMGAVYLAKQVSLDRHVAIKTIQARWAKNPVFVARFTREAYAAAQLTHHNVVQIYDLGSQDDINYFSMEFVKGESLAELVEQKGKLDPDEAVGYIIQAARGLNFAHNHGMVHRDIKPSNLMLNDQGVVKVADMGLVKTPHLQEESNAAGDPTAGPTGGGTSLAAATAEVTMANIAMGTPAYMAPEQATNAAGVDHKADIYSLGCTLYVLLTGRPPFEGASALEVITKHRTEPVIRPEAIVKRVPPELSEIVLKMVAKRPEDRFTGCNDVIRALEGYLGIKSTGVFSPTEEHAETLEKCLQAYNNAGLAKLRSIIALSFMGLGAGLFVLMLVVNSWLAGLLAAMLLTAPLVYFVLSGIGDRTYLFDRVRAYLLSYRWSDWLTWLGGALVAGLIVMVIGWILPGIIGAVLGAGLGAAFYYAIDKRLAAARREPVARIESLLKLLRLRGVEEEAIRQFIAKYSDQQWEEFFEELFGYEAKIRAREELARTDQGRRRKKFAAWREPLLKSIEAKLRADQELRDRKHLQKVEEENLKAQGVGEVQARRQAMNMAEALVDEAAEVRAQKADATVVQSGTLDPKVVAAQKRAKQLEMLAKARSQGYESKRRRASLALVTGPLGFLLGPKLRFLAGVLLLAGCVLWMNQNGISDAAANEDAESFFATFMSIMTGARETQPLSWPVIGGLFNSFGPGVAGVILVITGMARGNKMSIFAWPAAATAMFGSMFVSPVISYGIAGAIAVIGLFFGRSEE